MKNKKIRLNGIRTIFFDLDGTLRYSTPRWNDVQAATAVLLGAPDSPENRARAERWSFEYFSYQSDRDAREFAGDWEGFWNAFNRRYLQVFGCPEEMAACLAPELRQIMQEVYRSEDCVPEDVYATLAALREAGYCMGILTNRMGAVGKYLVEKGLEPYLDFYFTSGEIGYPKPHPAMFRHALAVTRSAPAQVVCVGDNWFADIVGAMNLGIQAVLIDPHGVFPEAVCPVIRTIGELQAMLLPRT